MVNAGQARKSINKHVGRIRRLIRWGVAEELVSTDVLLAIRALDGLQAGRSTAAESLPVLPVALRDVVAIRRHVPPQIYAMIELQIRTGMRPGEVVRLRTRDVDCAKSPWRYAVDGHKTEHLGKKRIVYVGPRAQRTLSPFLRLDEPDAFVFPPRDILVEQGKIRSRRKRAPGARYTTGSYRVAVQRACKKAGVPVWFPNQLRHTAATAIRAKSDLETARTVLGHSTAATTEIYAERDLETARKVMARVG
jgi:integrase